MVAKIITLGPNECPAQYSTLPNFVNCTSHSKDFGKGLSPFLIGPVELYSGAPAYFARNVENSWQYSKCFKEHIDKDGLPTEEYFKWAKNGFIKEKAVRYPMGKGRKAEFAWWGRKLDYIESRKIIYIPAYANAVKNTDSFKKLKELYNKFDRLLLWCFDCYSMEGLTYKDIINNPNKSLGHGFVLAMLLEDFDFSEL
jgi:hypothetical protein